MSHQRDREEFVALMTKEGVPLRVIQALMRASTTLHRLAERECNGDDWTVRALVPCPEAPKGTFNRQGVYIEPADSVERDVWCSVCGEKGKHARVTASTVKAGQVEQRVQALCKAHGLTPVFNGDPRGAVLKVKVPSGRTNDGWREGVCVP